MTYFGFLARFLIVPICLLVGLSLWDTRLGKTVRGFHRGRQFWLGLSILGLLAFVYTTPWDNYLVARRVWGYNPRLVSGLFWGWVPVEEYAFFILETLLTGLWWRWVVHHISPAPGDFLPSTLVRKVSLSIAALFWSGSAAILISGWIQGTYLALILAWGLPVLAVQLAFGADILWHHHRLIAATSIPVVLYLSAVDSLAIQSQTRKISPIFSTGIFLGSLPLEEAIFFLITVLIISCGLTLALASMSKLRWEPWRERYHRVMGLRRPTEDPSLQPNEFQSGSQLK